MVFVIQPVIPVDKLAIGLDDSGFALATGPAPTQEGRIDAAAFHRFEQAFVFADLNGDVRLAQAHLKGFAGLWGEEFL